MYNLQLYALTADQLPHLLSLTQRLDLAPGPGGSRMSDPITTEAAFSSALRWRFPGRWTSCTVIALYPSSQLVAHRDAPILGTRYHLPLQLNPGCWVFHAGTWQQLEVGRVYEMDPTEEHGAVNWGSDVRLHFIVDLEG